MTHGKREKANQGKGCDGERVAGTGDLEMTRWMPRLGLPLLGKELIEQAARKRTYVVRVVYATLLFLAAFLFFYETLSVAKASPLAVLGSGREMLMRLIGLQFVGIYAFMPAMMCSVLTCEKERGSLQLLFLTRLGPWTILFEKFFSRLIPMLGFLILSLPLLAFAYTLGGISPEFLWGGVWVLFLATIQTGSLALLCSAYFRTTVGALIWSYLGLVIMFVGPAIGWLIVGSVTGKSVGQWLQKFGFDRLTWEPVVNLPFFGPAAVFGPNILRLSAWLLIVHSVMVLVASGVFLIVARLCVVRRAFLLSNNVMLSVFKRLDRVFLRLNDNPLTRGFVLVGDTAPLPGDEPVAWRETAKRSLGKAQYLMRVFIALEIPVTVLCALIVGWANRGDVLGALLVPVWVIGVLILAAQSASLIAGERSHQTLDVLCATPLAGADIVRQKFRSVRRLMLVLAIPLFTIFGFESALRWRLPEQVFSANAPVREFDLPLYLVCSTLSVAVYLPLVAWLALGIGLKVKTQARAILGSIAAIAAWCFAPVLLVEMPLSILFGNQNGDLLREFSRMLSPVSIIGANEHAFRFNLSGAPWTAVFVNFLGYGAALVVVRHLCFKNADRLLGRPETNRPTGTLHECRISTQKEWERQALAARMNHNP